MRFRIKMRWSPTAPYQLCLSHASILVTRPTFPMGFLRSELRWTWPDNTEYTLRYPHSYGDGSWQIDSRKVTICSGRLVYPSLRDSILRAALPHTEWDCAGKSLVSKRIGCGREAVRGADGVRLVVWRSRMRSWEGVWRQSHRGIAPAVLFGIVLAGIHHD
jgi:hypothetical protein